MLITFGSGSSKYSSKTPSTFNFTTTTTHRQNFNSKIEDYQFGFVNAVPDYSGYWHKEAKDHTENDNDGYMYLVNIGAKDVSLFNFTVNNLCVGLQYEFFAYLANVDRKDKHLIKTDVRFEVRAANAGYQSLAKCSTGDIPAYDTMTWTKFGLSFTALHSSTILLIISNLKGGNGNNIAIDDIELRVCSNTHSSICHPG